MRTIILSAALLALPLAACSNALDPREGDMTADAGLAVRHDIAAQLVNPNAPTRHGATVTDGERAFRALDRYSKGAVKTPADASTKGGDSGTGGADSGNDSSSPKAP